MRKVIVSGHIGDVRGNALSTPTLHPPLGTMTYQQRKALAAKRLGDHAYAMAHGGRSPYFGRTAPVEEASRWEAEAADRGLIQWVC